MKFKNISITIVTFLLFGLLGANLMSTKADDTNDFDLSQVNPYITSVKLFDESHPGATSYGPYDNMKITWGFKVPKGTAIKAGESMVVTIPDVFDLQGTPEFDIVDEAGHVTAHVTTSPNRDSLIVTWTGDAVNTLQEKDLTGYLEISSTWNLKKIKVPSDVPINWNVPGNIKPPDSANVTPAPPAPKPADNKLRKDGGFASEAPGLLYWTIRANWAQDDIQNAQVTDHIGPMQTLDRSRPIQVFACSVVDGKVVQGKEIKPEKITYVNDREFIVDLGEIKEPVNIFYFTKFDTKAPKGTQFTNEAELSGQNRTIRR